MRRSDADDKLTENNETGVERAGTVDDRLELRYDGIGIDDSASDLPVESIV